MDEVLEYLQKAHMFYFATCDGDQPRVRPFGFVMKHKERLYFSVVAGKKVYNQLLANPKVELCIVGEGGTWLRLSGKAVFDTTEETLQARRDTHASGQTKGPDLKKIYANKPEPNYQLFYLEDCTAQIASHANGTREFKF